MAKAFVTGGIICTIGQTILNACEKGGNVKGYFCKLVFTDPDPGKWVLTGFGIYPKIANWGGAGSTGADHRICQFRCGAGN